jgi:acetolactate synthase-1/2/3 large subunit
MENEQIMQETYADQFCTMLRDAGYTHCFFVAGGNVMHLLNSARKIFKTVPVIHEVAASIATEYFNATSDGAKAFALVTAGPGITNALTGVAGAWLEGRELLIVGGQVKSSDLKSENLRQRGIQEIDGVRLLSSITKDSFRISEPIDLENVLKRILMGSTHKPGPIFIEFCLDAQGKVLQSKREQLIPAPLPILQANAKQINLSAKLIGEAQRPILLIGGGVERSALYNLQNKIKEIGIPIMTTWNGLDRIDSNDDLFWGRPDTWGQRAANILIQQSDLLIAIGSRLGLQQTGFNWQEFAPVAKIIHVESDRNELEKGHPVTDLQILADSNDYIFRLVDVLVQNQLPNWTEWKNFGRKVIAVLPNNEEVNTRSDNYLNTYDFVEELSSFLTPVDVIIPCSSGGAETTMMQAFQQKKGQKIVCNKSLASMGYGLSGAIGASFANPNKRVILVEGDGGFAQNIQEIGTVAIANLPIKIFIYSNGGYASIRMTQANYFQGAYVGCDTSTGLGLPDLEKLFLVYGISVDVLDPKNPFRADVVTKLNDASPHAFIVPVDPEQTYFPKITSKVLPNGQMESNPLHIMTPELPDNVKSEVYKYLPS